jgi:hypothetical protein
MLFRAGGQTLLAIGHDQKPSVRKGPHRGAAHLDASAHTCTSSHRRWPQHRRPIARATKRAYPLPGVSSGAAKSISAIHMTRVSGWCKDNLEHRAALGTFVEQEGVESTTNLTELLSGLSGGRSSRHGLWHSQRVARTNLRVALW